jgi:SAM-dependent methyltransferase
MKTLPAVDLSYRPLHELAMGPLKAAFMNYGIRFKVFDILTEFASTEQVATRLGTHPENTRRLLDALATMDLLEKQGGRYRNLPIARLFLVSTEPTCIGPLLLQAQHAGLNPLEKLAGLVKNGPDADQDVQNFADESLWAREARDSSGWVFGGVGRQVADIIKTLPGFGEFGKMLDMGCGHGVFSLYMLHDHPTLRAVLLDRAAVLEAAERFVHEWGMADRVEYAPGDYITGDIGKGYDLIFASATLNFALHGLEELISKVFRALKPGGYFVGFQDGMTHEGTKPDTMLGAVMPAMMLGMDYTFPQGRIAHAAVDRGFCWVRSRTIPTPIGDMDVDIARKG